jgi:UDP-glucose 4-epimerase
VEGASTQSDGRFRAIANAAVNGADVEVRAGDGTQFISAGDLAQLYEAVLTSDRTREAYYGLAVPFTSWETIGRMAVELADSQSRVVASGTADPPDLFVLDKIHEHFGLSFTSTEALTGHVEYCVKAAGAGSVEWSQSD